MIPNYVKEKVIKKLVNGITITSNNLDTLKSCKYSTPVAFGGNVTLNNITIPIYAKGMLFTSNSNDASLIAIDSQRKFLYSI
jgi:hypothetical protein